MPIKILITPRSLTKEGHPDLRRLTEAGYELVFSLPGKQPGEEELLRLLPGCAGYLAGVEPVTARVLEAAQGLRAISRNGTGVDNIDLEAAKRLGIAVLRAEGANARGVAEFAVGLMFALARSVPFSDHVLKRGEWERRKGMELLGKTLGVVGCGRIGRQVAEMALGLGMQVVAYDLLPDPMFQPSSQFRYSSLDALLASADVLTLHAPPLPGSRPLLDSTALAKTRRGVLIINTARHDLIDPDALLTALDSGQVAGAAIDVFDREPPAGSPLAAHDRVIATPHVGGFTEESVGRSVGAAVTNLLDCLGPN
jgi:D-3-phosphoglycerate dehydrogenase / 2-oxoglutarate reductase